jgi:hypothetical protein
LPGLVLSDFDVEVEEANESLAVLLRRPVYIFLKLAFV